MEGKAYQVMEAKDQIKHLLDLPRHRLESRLIVALMGDAKPEAVLTAVVSYRTTAGRWQADAADNGSDSKAVRSKAKGNRVKFGATSTTVNDGWEFQLHEVATAIRAVAKSTGTDEWPYALAWVNQASETKAQILHGIVGK